MSADPPRENDTPGGIVLFQGDRSGNMGTMGQNRRRMETTVQQRWYVVGDQMPSGAYRELESGR